MQMLQKILVIFIIATKTMNMQLSISKSILMIARMLTIFIITGLAGALMILANMKMPQTILKNMSLKQMRQSKEMGRARLCSLQKQKL
jgi:hypothetical protein